MSIKEGRTSSDTTPYTGESQPRGAQKKEQRMNREESPCGGESHSQKRAIHRRKSYPRGRGDVQKRGWKDLEIDS
jgi:hypothetical protein